VENGTVFHYSMHAFHYRMQARSSNLIPQFFSTSSSPLKEAVIVKCSNT